MSAFISGERRNDVYRSERHSHLDAFAPAEPSDVIRIYAACSNGPCDQGRRLCPSPTACQAAEPDEYESTSAVGFIVCLLVAVVLVVLIGIAVVLAPVGVGK